MSLENIIEQVKPYLSDYLKSQNIQVNSSGALKCIHPDHDDNSASMQLSTKSGNTYVFCHSCKSVYDIFSAASLLEELPSDGIDWIEDNVLVLAQRFNVEFDKNIAGYISRDPKYTLAYKAYKDAAIIVAESTLSKKAIEYVEEHGWDDKVTTEFMLGSVDAEDICNSLIQVGYETNFLDEIGLLDRGLFSENNLIFPIHDAKKRVIGFTARRFDVKPKYLNTAITPYGPYKKNESLYNIHRIKDMNGPLYIVEGQTDAISLWSKGIRAVAINGSKISSQHITDLNHLGLGKIIIWMDNDQPGQQSLLDNILPSVLKNQLHPIPDVAIYPEGCLYGDPDVYVRAEDTVPEYLDILHAYSQFLTKDEEYSRDKLCEELVLLASYYLSPIARNLLAKSIANITGISEAAIFARLEDINRERLERTDEQRARIIDDAIYKLKGNPNDASRILVNTLGTLETVSHAQENLGTDSFLSYVRDIKTKEEEQDGTHPGFIIDGFKQVQNAFEGDWNEKLILVAGAENSGKSQLLSALTYSIVKNPKNDAMVILHLTDDSTKDMLPRLACLSDSPRDHKALRFVDITNPRYAYDPARIQEGMKRREKAYQKLYELILDERIIIKDVRAGGDLEFGEALIRYYKNRYPNRKIIYALDSINRVTVPFHAMADERKQMTYRSNTLAKMAVRHEITVMAVAEFNREFNQVPGDEPVFPTNRRLAEARALEFDANGIILIYNDLHVRGPEKASILWRDTLGNARPRLALCITKNKISNWKGKIFMDFDEVRSLFTERDIAAVRNEWAIEQARILQEAKDHQDQVSAYSKSSSNLGASLKGV